MAYAFIEDQQDRQITQIASFSAALSQYGIDQSSSLLAAQIATMRSLSMLEEAVPVNKSIADSTVRRNVLLAGFLGLLGAVALVYVLERLDESIRGQDELKELTGLPVLGAVLFHPRSGEPAEMVMSRGGRHGHQSEAYKFIRTNLEFLGLESQGVRTLLVTSSSPQEGKTTTATNIAISAANEGKSVVLVDSDLRRPRLHKLFAVNGTAGLTTVLLGETTLDKALYPASGTPGLTVLPAGPLPVDPTPVLRSRAMKDLVAELKRTYDLAVFDTGPALAVTDPLILATLVDGVILVVADRSSRRSATRQAAANLRQANPKVMGTVINKVRRKGGGYYSHYYYYYHHQYYSSSNGHEGETGLRSRLAATLGRFRRSAPSGKRNGASPPPEGPATEGGAAPNGADPERTGRQA